MPSAVTLLWHMHQPYYRNSVGGEYRMPWSFLHAAKDYYDMLGLAVEAGARVTFNLVPSLLDQLEDYGNPAVADTFLDLVRPDPSRLNEEARFELLPRLFFANLENQIRPFPRYFELQQKRLYHGRGAAAAFSNEEFLDLEVLFLLAWTGEVIRAEEPAVSKLLAKGRAYSSADKASLLSVLHRVAGRTAEAYREAQELGRIEISTTPYYHPILPLLIDMQSARQALPRATLPILQRGFGEDAARHVERAVARYRSAFGRAPSGFWPSEGSVSTETLALLARNGLRWAATDEDILAATLGTPLSGRARSELYRPHTYRSPEGQEISVFFRDKTLSDLIGFSYASWEPEAAARDFAGRLAALAREYGPGATLSVILDGENAWEFYRANGAPFLRALYRAVAAEPELEFRTFSERLGDGRPLSRIHAGSWIYGSFSTWMGHPEKNRAWELLDRTRCALVDGQEALSAERRELAWQEIHVAEGSDWFWWLGDDHYSPIAGEFDDLFRLHLMNVYRLLGVDSPGELHLPIKGGGRRGLLEEPIAPVTPRVDGRISSYFEWYFAGTFDLGYDAGAMHRGGRILRTLRFGAGEGRLVLCLTGAESDSVKGAGFALEVEALGTRRLRVRFPIDEEGGAPEVVEGSVDPSDLSFAWEKVGEVALPLGALGLGPAGDLCLSFRILRGGEVLEKAPLYHMVQVQLPNDYALECWSA
ncbi:MAG: glycoside hydrolase [Deltaproteobacteria bacterium]|nr:glycoside hydrolase [Deltaproteobacteria bacterium]